MRVCGGVVVWGGCRCVYEGGVQVCVCVCVWVYVFGV